MSPTAKHEPGREPGRDLGAPQGRQADGAAFDADAGREHPRRRPGWLGIGRPTGPDFVAGARPSASSASSAIESTSPLDPDDDRPSYATFTPRPSGGSVALPGASTPEPSASTRRRRAGIVALTVLGVALVGGISGLGAAQLWGPSVEDEPSPILSQGQASGLWPAVPGSTEAAAESIVPSVVQVTTGGGRSGSGFVYDNRGHIITNHHVVRGLSQVRLRLHSGRTVSAQVVGGSAEDDIAVLRVTDPQALPAARLGRALDLRIGQPVIAVGSPLGLRGTVTAGIVSSVDRQARINGTSQRFVQTDAPINPGNSGGPLVDLDGRVVGVNTAIATVDGRSSGSIGIGFSVPMERAQQVANRIIRGR